MMRSSLHHIRSKAVHFLKNLGIATSIFATLTAPMPSKTQDTIKEREEEEEIEIEKDKIWFENLEKRIKKSNEQYVDILEKDKIRLYEEYETIKNKNMLLEKQLQINLENIENMKQLLTHSLDFSGFLDRYYPDIDKKTVDDVMLLSDQIKRDYGISVSFLAKKVSYEDKESFILPYPEKIDIDEISSQLEQLLRSLRKFPPALFGQREIQLILMDHIQGSNDKAYYNDFYGMIVLDTKNFNVTTFIHELTHLLDYTYGIADKIELPVSNVKFYTDYPEEILLIGEKIKNLKTLSQKLNQEYNQKSDSISNPLLALQEIALEIMKIESSLSDQHRKQTDKVDDYLCEKNGLLTPKEYGDILRDNVDASFLQAYNADHHTSLDMDSLQTLLDTDSDLKEKHEMLLQKYGLPSEEQLDVLDSLYEAEYGMIYDKEIKDPKRGITLLDNQREQLQWFHDEINHKIDSLYKLRKTLVQSSLAAERIKIGTEFDVALRLIQDGPLHGYVTSYAKTGGEKEHLAELLAHVLVGSEELNIVALVEGLSQLDREHPGRGFHSALKLHVDTIEYLFGVRLSRSSDQEGGWYFVDLEAKQGRLQELLTKKYPSIQQSSFLNADYLNRLHGLGTYTGQQREIIERKNAEQEDGSYISLPIWKQIIKEE